MIRLYGGVGVGGVRIFRGEEGGEEGGLGWVLSGDNPGVASY
jgi:hypothetical protein